MKDRKCLDPDRRFGREEEKEVDGGQIMIRIYYVRKKIYFQ